MRSILLTNNRISEYETHIPTVTAQAPQQTRLPRAYVHSQRTQGTRSTPSSRPQETDRILRGPLLASGRLRKILDSQHSALKNKMPGSSCPAFYFYPHGLSATVQSHFRSYLLRHRSPHTFRLEPGDVGDSRAVKCNDLPGDRTEITGLVRCRRCQDSGNEKNYSSHSC